MRADRRAGRDLAATFRTLCDRHALILPRPTQARNSGRAEQCWVWLGATEGVLDASEIVLRTSSLGQRGLLRKEPLPVAIAC